MRNMKIIALLVIVGSLVVFCVPKPSIVEIADTGMPDDSGRHWRILWEGSLAEAVENNPAGGTGFLEIFWINHTATPATTFKQNSSTTLEAWCVANMPGLTPYANLDNFNVTISSSKLFDIVVRCSWNKTVAFDYSKSQFDVAAVRVNISVTGGGITIPITPCGSTVASYNNSGAAKLWTNTYWNNAGTGYYIAKNGVCTIAQIRLEALY
jgi:hypothetical protein